MKRYCLQIMLIVGLLDFLLYMKFYELNWLTASVNTINQNGYPGINFYIYYIKDTLIPLSRYSRRINIE